MKRNVTDFCIPELDIYARLSEVQLRRLCEPEPGIFLAETQTVIARALDAGYEPVSFLVDSQKLRDLEAFSRWTDQVPVYAAEHDVLRQLTGYELTRGMLCAMRRKELPDPKDIFAGTQRIAVLENVMNPTNIGAIFRSAAAMDMDAVLLTAGCADPFYRRAIRVSMGTVFQIPWTYLDGEAQEGALPGIRRLKENGFLTVSMALREDAVSICDPRIREAKKLAVILGTEGEGLTDAAIAASDYTVCIPMSHGVDSLNVAAASAVAFWEIGKRPGCDDQQPARFHPSCSTNKI